MLLFWCIYLYTLFFVLFLSFCFNILVLLSMLIFQYNIPCRGSVLVMSVYYSRGFLYLDGQRFLEICGVFCCYSVEYISSDFCLHFFEAHDWQVWSFDGVAEFLHILFTALQSFLKVFFCFFLFNICFVFKSEILSSTSSSTLVWLSTLFLLT
jgi:hypothetical protein